MAEKKPLINTDLFARTEPPEMSLRKDDIPGDKDIISARGVGLKLSEWRELDAIAKDLGMNSHALRTYAIRRFLSEYKAGKIQATTKTRTVKELPKA